MIAIVCGTNRMDSITLKICEFYQSLLMDLGQETYIVDLNKLPEDFAFSALYENSGKNAAFNTFREIMRQATKYVFVVPEYNGSFPGVLKTFIDGLDYPSPFAGKKCALVGFSSGGQGGGLALSHLTDIFNYCGMHVLAYKPKLPQIEANMDMNYNFTNPRYADWLSRQAHQFVQF